jgi:inner membrane transporter RhtA
VEDRGVSRPGELKPSKRARPALLVLLSATSVQTGAALAVSVFTSTSPVAASFLRTLFGGSALSAVAIARGKRFKLSDFRAAIPFGLTVCFTNTAFYLAINRLPLGDAVAIEFVGPIAVAVATARRKSDVVWALLALLGVFSITRRTSGPLNGLGLIFVLCAGFGWGLYTIVGRKLSNSERREESVAAGLLLGSGVLLIPALIISGTTLAHSSVLLPCLALGILSSAVPYTIELIAMTGTSASSFGVLLSLQPFMATAAGLLLLHQSVSGPEVIGFALISVASAAVSLRQPTADIVAVE